MNWRTPIVTLAVTVLAVCAYAQEEYTDTITLISGESRTVRIDKIRSKGKKIDFYVPGDPKVKTVKTSSVDTFIVAADIPYYRALEYFDYGRTDWFSDGSERNKDANSRDLERRVEEWLNTPSPYPNEFSAEDEFEVGVIRGMGNLRLGVSTFLEYNMIVQTFGQNYTWRISDLRMSSGETLAEYIRLNCYSNNKLKPVVSEHHKSIIAQSANALQEMTTSLNEVLEE